MIHELEEQKANLFNFQKELSKNKSKKNTNLKFNEICSIVINKIILIFIYL